MYVCEEDILHTAMNETRKVILYISLHCNVSQNTTYHSTYNTNITLLLQCTYDNTFSIAVRGQDVCECESKVHLQNILHFPQLITK